NSPPFDIPASTGIPKGTIESVIVLPTDLDTLERVLASDKDIAGVITEASGASYGTVPLPTGFLEGVRRLTKQYGVVMVLDEVITGFRWSPGGAQRKFGLDTDLCTMAKILTGGMPGGAVAGKEEFMQVLYQTGDTHHDRYERVYHGGTFNANPYAAATGNAALEIVATGEMQDQADRMAERLRVGLREIIDRYEVAACVYGESSTFHLYFGQRSIEGLDATALKDQPQEILRNFRQALQVRGVDLMSRTSGVLSGTHTEADIDQALAAFDGAFKAMMDEGLVSHN
ncbi:MAG TPA: aminotransferase class III-fold pyridoxal phosphate-dependent enzyme, partial [Dehalococcoidia bacterium]|nr:aminotransferase class III-fold pyridoxal phosphate-dependent enzyme [Dehalococcoidia bacterium]